MNNIYTHEFNISLVQLNLFRFYRVIKSVHLQQSPFFFFPFLLPVSANTDPLLFELARSFYFDPAPTWTAAFACLSLIAFDMWKNVSLTLCPVRALVSKNAMPNSLARAIPYSVSMTFLSRRSALFPIRILSTFWLACTSI